MSWLLWVLLAAVAVFVLLVVAFVVLGSIDTGPGEPDRDADAALKKDADDIRYIETRLATDWGDRIAWIETANPSYKRHFRNLAKWWVEVLDEEPWREIGFDAASNAIVAGPTDTVYGFWCDTNMTLHDFQDQDPKLREVSETDFEAAWDKFFDSSPEGE